MSQDDRPYAKPMTAEQRYRQEILMYVRDEIIDPIMPPVKKYNKKLDVWLKSRDYILIDQLAAKHTDALIQLVKRKQ